ncbi:3979_t:CDS:2, partial [Gigaspora rosea]
LPRPIDKANKIIPLYPIRLSFKTLVILNEREFITEVVQSNSIFGLCPGYICKCGKVQSEICESATMAISMVYCNIFKTKAKFSGPEVLEFDKAIITTMLKYVGCSDVTPMKRINQSDKSSLSILYNLGFVIPTPSSSYSTNTFWSSFHKSLNTNKCGTDGRRRVLSIIANDFNYEVIRKNLGVSNDLICAARKHSHIYGPGGLVTEKPIIRHEKMSAEKNSQLQSFLMDKANVVMSSYKTDPLTNEL